MATTFTDHARNEGQRVTLITITRADPATATISSSTELEINQELTFPETAACLILFTSGTTGPPKGIVLPRKMFHYEEDITPATLYLASCPPHWIGGTGLIDSVLIGENLHMLKSEAPPCPVLGSTEGRKSHRNGHIPDDAETFDGVLPGTYQPSCR
jgi:malonyl-CoA/methylmalonyl-CoA synthetase